MADSLKLELLNPETDLALFQEAYSWRSPKKHAQPDRAPFESFISPSPRQIVAGLFNGQFLAAYVLYEFDPKCYEAHFTSRRNVPRETLLAGARMVIDAFFQNGAEQIIGWVVVRNRAMGKFLEDLGFV